MAAVTRCWAGTSTELLSLSLVARTVPSVTVNVAAASSASTLKRVPNTLNKAVRVWTSIGLSLGCGITLAVKPPSLSRSFF